MRADVVREFPAALHGVFKRLAGVSSISTGQWFQGGQQAGQVAERLYLAHQERLGAAVIAVEHGAELVTGHGHRGGTLARIVEERASFVRMLAVTSITSTSPRMRGLDDGSDRAARTESMKAAGTLPGRN